MEKGFCYRLLRGRQGISGHVQAYGAGERIVIRGLSPGEICEIYFLDGEARPAGSMTTDAQGQGEYRTAEPGRYFIACSDRVILWEDEERMEENYLQACARLRNWHGIQTCREKETKKEAEEVTVPALLEPEIVFVAVPEMEKSVSSISASREEPVEDAGYSLRTPGDGEGVDGLPSLIWPEGAEGLRIYFDRLPPYAPFDLPGWRFVRTPSPVPGCAFCALGYEAKGGRVCRIAYALPGSPHHPPVRLAGYSFLWGRDGQGYWVLQQQTE